MSGFKMACMTPAPVNSDPSVSADRKKNCLLFEGAMVIAAIRRDFGLLPHARATVSRARCEHCGHGQAEVRGGGAAAFGTATA